MAIKTTEQAKSKFPPLQPGEDPLDIFRYDGIEIVGDIVAPLYTDKEYEEFFEASCAKFEGTPGYRRKDEV